MENISKVLIIAGSVLMAILIISFSVFVINVLNKPVTQASNNMSGEEKAFFNNKFQRYEGARVAGLETKALVNILLQNSTHQTKLNELGKIPKVKVKLNLKVFNLDFNSTLEGYQEVLNEIKNTRFYFIGTKLNAKNGIISEIVITEL